MQNGILCVILKEIELIINNVPLALSFVKLAHMTQAPTLNNENGLNAAGEV